ncbi:MAG: hypothetical protein QM451_07795 [Bacillota bacterium]|jgi:hypothetical protein|nr:hypothetical protein [Bacillota bacterium]HHT91469.1 hypothetical protein [Bacillota bacterium]
MRINLLPKEARPLKQSQVRWEFLVGILGLLILGVVTLFSVLGHLTVSDLQTAERDALAREARLLQEVQIVHSIRKELTQLQEKEQSHLAQIVPASQAPLALPTVSKHSFGGLWIESLQWTEAGVEVLGYTQDPISLSQYLYFLSERSEEVLIRSINNIGTTGFRVFVMEAKGVDPDGSLELH